MALLVFIVPGAIGAPSLHAVVPDLPGPGPGDEGFAVDADGMDMAGWTVTDGEGTWVLPPCDGICWSTGNLTAWYAYDGPAATRWNATRLVLANAGDSLSLMDPDGHVVDEVAWGPGTGLPYRSPGAMYVQGQDGWVTPRIHRMGESDLDRPTFTVDHLTLYASPDSGFQVLTALIANATTRLHLHVHDLSHPALLDALVQSKTDHPGLDLQVLVDGRVPGRTRADEAELQGQWARMMAVGGSVVVAEGGRYAHHHLKVLVADDAVAVQSENWNLAGVPEDPSWGNRGWGVVVHDPAFADWMADWMAADRTAWDMNPLDAEPATPLPHFPLPRGDHVPRPPHDLTGSFQVTPIISPDHTADPADDPVLAAMEDASRRIWGQQLSLGSKESNALGWSAPERTTKALTTAADAGVDVRLHLAGPFGYDDVRNHRVARDLQSAGVEVQVWDHPTLGTLHNKGWIIDDSVVIGSMNSHHASRSNNREVGVILHGKGVAAWYAQQFVADDSATDGHPLTAAPVPMLLVVMAVARACRPV